MKIHLEMNKDYGNVVATGTSSVLFIIIYVVCFGETFMTVTIWSDQLNAGEVILVSKCSWHVLSWKIEHSFVNVLVVLC